MNVLCGLREHGRVLQSHAAVRDDQPLQFGKGRRPFGLLLLAVCKASEFTIGRVETFPAASEVLEHSLVLGHACQHLQLIRVAAKRSVSHQTDMTYEVAIAAGSRERRAMRRRSRRSNDTFNEEGASDVSAQYSKGCNPPGFSSRISSASPLSQTCFQLVAAANDFC